MIYLSSFPLQWWKVSASKYPVLNDVTFDIIVLASSVLFKRKSHDGVVIWTIVITWVPYQHGCPCVL